MVLADAASTNVSVGARIRPLFPREVQDGATNCLSVHEGRTGAVGNPRTFTFDRAYDSRATQEEVYQAQVQPLVDAVVSGYNAAVLAYGQTATGKTFTMGTAAPEVEEHLSGMCPRVIEALFQHADATSQQVDYRFSCCYLEVYNEELRDLLRPQTPKQLLQIREDTDGNIRVTGICERTATSRRELLQVLQEGSQGRTTGSTLMNEHSSRSHSIFTVMVEMRDKTLCAGDPESWSSEATTSHASYKTAKFHLVDLAGSERAKR